jgi:hypothetical protein
VLVKDKPDIWNWERHSSKCKNARSQQQNSVKSAVLPKGPFFITSWGNFKRSVFLIQYGTYAFFFTRFFYFCSFAKIFICEVLIFALSHWVVFFSWLLLAQSANFNFRAFFVFPWNMWKLEPMKKGPYSKMTDMEPTGS